MATKREIITTIIGWALLIIGTILAVASGPRP